VTDRSWVEGDSRYLGTETDLGITWRFAPNLAFDVLGAYLFAGAALDTHECTTTASSSNPCGTGATSYVKREANDAYLLMSRVRLSF